jgi:hypothetical protein
MANVGIVLNILGKWLCCAQNSARSNVSIQLLTRTVATVSGLGLHDYRLIVEDTSGIPGQSLVHIYQVRAVR